MPSSHKQARRTATLSKCAVFWAVVALMGVAILVLLGLSVWGNGSDAQRQVVSLCADFLKGGFGALLTLLGTRGR